MKSLKPLINSQKGKRKKFEKLNIYDMIRFIESKGYHVRTEKQELENIASIRKTLINEIEDHKQHKIAIEKCKKGHHDFRNYLVTASVTRQRCSVCGKINIIED